MSTYKIYVILLMLSLLSYILGWLDTQSWFVFTLLLIAFLKGKYIIEYFMELKTTSLLYRMIPLGWLFLILLIIGVCYYVPIS